MATKVPFLNWFENWCFYYLARSPRVGTIQVRWRHTPATFIVRDLNDPCVEKISDDEMTPASFDLERIFHMPSYGETDG
jgi:hypothetical protein